MASAAPEPPGVVLDCDAGIDDAWQKCGSYGPQNYTYHDATGAPVVDTGKFPSFKDMCDAAHAMNLTCGWWVLVARASEKSTGSVIFSRG